jgi:hypothetical protein
MEVETYDVVWNEDAICPKCGCRVLKECYSTVYSGHGPLRDYSHDIITIQCPYCDYDVTETIEEDKDNEPTM